MPYSRDEELPPAIRRTLPPHAREIYRAAFNSAWEQRMRRGNVDEAAVHRIAWGAVKRQYHKVGEMWVPRAQDTGGPAWAARIE